MIPEYVCTYISQFVEAHSGVIEIWLFGSRANCTSHDDSDWDLMVFGSEAVLQDLQRDIRFIDPMFDVLVVYDGDKFAGLQTQNQKNGSLTEWQWTKDSAELATYHATKAVFNEHGEEEFNSVPKCCRAIRIFPVALFFAMFIKYCLRRMVCR